MFKLTYNIKCIHMHCIFIYTIFYLSHKNFFNGVPRNTTATHSPSGLNTDISSMILAQIKRREETALQIMRWQRQNYHLCDALIGFQSCHLIHVSSKSSPQDLLPVSLLTREQVAQNLHTRLVAMARRALF